MSTEQEWYVDQVVAAFDGLRPQDREYLMGKHPALYYALIKLSAHHAAKQTVAAEIKAKTRARKWWLR